MTGAAEDAEHAASEEYPDHMAEVEDRVTKLRRASRGRLTATFLRRQSSFELAVG